MSTPAPASPRACRRPDQRAVAAGAGAVHVAWSRRPAAADGPSIEGMYVPEFDGSGPDGGLDIPWRVLSMAGLVIALVAATVAVIVLAGRLAERRRHTPPRSIVRDRRR